MLSEKLKRLRTSRGITQTELANALNYSISSICMYEKGERTPHVGVLEKIAEFFDVPVAYLLSDDKPGSYYLDQETAEKAQALFADPDMRILFDAAKDSRPEDLQMAADLLRRLKGDA